MEFSKSISQVTTLLQKTKFLLSAIVISVLIHFFFISSFSIYIKGTSAPVIYSWLDIIDKNELFLNNRKNIMRRDLLLFAENPSKKYFSETLSNDYPYLLKDKHQEEIFPSPKIAETIDEKKFLKETTEYFYIWEKQSLMASEKNEIIPYKILVSPYGKAILSFPEKLSSDTQETIVLQEYIREASFFLNDKFYWTKLKGIVK